MKLFNILAGLIVAAGMFVGTTTVVNAATNDLSCEVYARTYSVDKNTVTAIFEVKQIGDKTCTKDVTVASWKATSLSGQPYEDQTFLDSASGTFAPGYHSLTVQKPECGFYQVDLLRGLSPYGPDGHNDYEAGQFVSSNHGGQECKTPVKPEKPVKPVQKIVQVEKVEVESLPNTGPGAALPLAGAIGLGAGAAHRVYSRRKLDK